MNWNFILLIAFTVGCYISHFAQDSSKRVMDPTVYKEWKDIEGAQISAQGDWVAYTLKPGEGDPQLALYEVASGETVWYPRSDKATFSYDGKFLFFTIHPSDDTLKFYKRKDLPKADWPGDSLGIYSLTDQNLLKIPHLKSLKTPRRWSGWIAYQTGTKEGKSQTLHLHQLSTGEEDTLMSVSAFEFAEEGKYLLAIQEEVDSVQEAGVNFYDCEAESWTQLWEAKGKYAQWGLSRDGEQVAFVLDQDTTKALIRPYELAYWKKGWDKAQIVFDDTQEDLPDSYLLSSDFKPTFSKDGKRLLFGIRSYPVVKDTSILDEEQVQVEVWTYKDPQLYTQQEVGLKREKKRSYKAILNLSSMNINFLADREMPELSWGDEGNADWAIGYAEEMYQQEMSWEGFARKDLYKIRVSSGERSLLAQGIGGQPRLSPGGKYAFWYDLPDSSWQAIDLASDRRINLSQAIPTPMYDELNDRPMHPYPNGMAAWMEGDSHILLYDRYDIWKVSLSNPSQVQNLTNGRDGDSRYRYIQLDPEQRFIPTNSTLLLHYTNETSLQQGYSWLNLEDGSLSTPLKGDFALSRRPLKARQADKILFTQEDFEVFPDLQLTNSQFSPPVKISLANPQQGEYRWGSIERVSWTSLDGIPLQGLLVKPEGFDPEKQYPMIVNFYERSSQGLHRHRAPEPHRSTINYSYYASRGYIIFNPDVVYREGYPGESAYNCVIPGVTKLLETGYIDPDRIGVQGHSWGGYQIAYLLTRTNIFRAAEAGAPVVNMISAYGGIRWGSGLSRMFQYERTQSRIGGTLWDYPLRYMENSPIFTLDKIQTPVLILHNDEDGAVPWYQGIEFFVGMRRLGKPVWLLNYNGEPHWPLKWQNRLDFNLRMSQFFDHYLKEAPLPTWMEKGVSPLQKGIEQGFELLKE